MLVDYLTSGKSAERYQATVEVGNDLHVPALCDVEIASAIRTMLRERRVSPARANEIVADYLDLPLRRHGHMLLLARILALRDSFSPYDATYVALAEILNAQLLTADDRLARAVRGTPGLSVRLLD